VQSVARTGAHGDDTSDRHGIQEVEGSIPFGSTLFAPLDTWWHSRGHAIFKSWCAVRGEASAAIAGVVGGGSHPGAIEQ